MASRAIIPSAICDISITIGKCNISARVLYLGLFVVFTVDANLLPPFLPIPSISDKLCKIGDTVELYGLNGEHQLVQRRTEIRRISAIGTLEPSTPSWRIINTEGYALLDTPYTLGGVLVDPIDSSIIAFWMEVKYGDSNYFVGLNYHYYIHPIIEALKTGEEVQSWSPGWRFGQLHLAKAIDLGFPEHHAMRIDDIAKCIGTGPQAIRVIERLRRSSSDLEVGDFILEIDDEPVGRMADVRSLSRTEVTKVLVFRDGREKEVILHSKRLHSENMPRLICWAGAVLEQSPYYALEQTTSEFSHVVKEEGITNPETLIYINSNFKGSPAEGTLPSVRWILDIDGRKVDSVEVLLDIIMTLKEKNQSEDYIRVKLIEKQGIPSIIGVKLNSHFWPAWIMERKGKQWIRTELESDVDIQ